MILMPRVPRDLRVKLASITWAHWAVLILVLASIVFELLMNYDYLRHGFKSAVSLNSGQSGFWMRMRANFTLVCMFTPSVITFYFMRLTCKELLARHQLHKGQVDVEFQQVIEEIQMDQSEEV